MMGMLVPCLRCADGIDYTLPYRTLQPSAGEVETVPLWSYAFGLKLGSTIARCVFFVGQCRGCWSCYWAADQDSLTEILRVQLLFEADRSRRQS
jgi:hypothetical protein